MTRYDYLREYLLTVTVVELESGYGLPNLVENSSAVLANSLSNLVDA